MRIDPHVHFRDEEQDYKETIAHGLETAKKQGVDIVFDMPNTAKLILTEEDVRRRLKLVPESERGRYFLYIGTTSDEEQLKEAVRIVKEVKEVIGMKMYAGKSTGDLSVLQEEAQRKVYKILAENNYTGLLAVHCEKQELMNEEMFDPNNPITHALSRPNEAEIESVKTQIKLAKEANFKGTLHVAHVSCKGSIEAIQEFGDGLRITSGVCPHHLMWTDEKLKGEHGLLYKMNPPLRSEEDMLALREFLKEGKIDWIETDHAPHTIGEKLFEGYPSGYPSLYLYKELVERLLPEWGFSDKQIEEITHHNIVKAFKLDL